LNRRSQGGGITFFHIRKKKQLNLSLLLLISATLSQPLLLKDEHELLQLLKVGSEHAFAKIFNHYKGRIYSVALKFLKSPIGAEEIVQEVFLKLWLKRTELEDIRRLDNYLFILARNLILDRIKKLSYESASKMEQFRFAGMESTIEDSDHLLRQHQCQQIIKDAVDGLPQQQKRVYIYARMGISKLTVKTHMAKALQSIRHYLEIHLHYLPLLPLLTTTIDLGNQSALGLI
jgi:RNA polymerase sigma-70 factor (ECF subfamily)